MRTMHKKLLILILDAFSNRYLKHADYINELCVKNYCTTIRPIFAYEGVRVAILTGLDVFRSKIWHDKVFIPKGRMEFKLKIIEGLLTVLDTFCLTDDANKVLRYIVFKIFQEEYGTPHLIPPQYLKYFKTITYKHINTQNIFRILEKKGIKSLWIEPKLIHREIAWLRKLSRLFKQYNLIFLKLNSLDRLGHKYGPFSKQVMRRIKRLNYEVRKSLVELNEKYRDVFFIIMSDHGMTPVKKTIDIEAMLHSKIHLKPLKDYFYYIGSTFASFWVFNSSAKEKLINMLHELENHGKILTKKELESLGVNSYLYGHIIFALNEGFVFFPDFFHRRSPPRGMHGYLNTKYDKPIFITNIDKANICSRILNLQQLEFVDVYWIVHDFFEYL